MDQITIEQIQIKLHKQVFSYYESYDQNKIDEILKQKEAFINKVFFAYEKKINGYRIEYEVYYYVGNITFLPTKTDSANLTLDLKIDKNLIHSIISHSLKNVVEVCDKQTEMFKSLYVNHNKKLLD